MQRFVCPSCGYTADEADDFRPKCERDNDTGTYYYPCPRCHDDMDVLEVERCAICDNLCLEAKEGEDGNSYCQSCVSAVKKRFSAVMNEYFDENELEALDIACDGMYIAEAVHGKEIRYDT